MSDTLVETLATFRDMIRQVSPPWLQRGLAERLLYAIGIHADVFGDAVVAAVKHRFPGLYNYESLPLLARERRIVRGRLESDAGYAERLRRFLLDHQVRGNPYALLSQLFAFWPPNTFPIDLVYVAGARYFQMDGAGAITRWLLPDWRPDSNAAKWARWWLFYYTDTWAAAPPTAAELQDLRLVPRAWNAAHSIGTIVLFSAASELWNWPPGRTWNESGVWNTSGTPRFIEVD